MALLLQAPGALWRIAVEMFAPPGISYVGRAMEGMVESIQIAWIGTLIAAVGGGTAGGRRQVAGATGGAAPGANT